ncbi:kinase-like domain-containing protein [Echria macrotheca]|uniref:Kinase-like domain-containing protein n=1 Tax=Echria macrotheca TaxID=438768 RepID=A0AAJ0F182_9PEZI|nr:kinase-like domain-containing protein [Echria macrotheca]
MSRLNQDEKNALTAWVLDALSRTRYACSTLTPLSGGSANFVFRGELRTPIDPETKTVIVKHSTDFLLVNRDFNIDLSRCSAEATILRALNGADYQLPFIAPRLLHYDAETNTQVHEDFHDAVLLDPTVLHSSGVVLSWGSDSFAKQIGSRLGSALRAFHDWAAQPEQSPLRSEIWRNEPMRKLKHDTTYVNFIRMLENFPSLLDGCRKSLEQVQAMAADEFAKSPADMEGDPDWGLIHGDFWLGNALVNPDHSEHLVLIDWELAQFGHRAYDLGQMVSDLVEKQMLDGLSAEMAWTLEGFARGYGSISEDLAFRTAIHAGARYLYWYVRRPPGPELRADPDRLLRMMRFGRDMILKGWERDRGWFLQTDLAPLFGSFPGDPI